MRKGINNYPDHIDESGDKLRQYPLKKEEKNKPSNKEKMTYQANQERGLEKAHKSFEEKDTEETTKENLEKLKEEKEKQEEAQHQTKKTQKKEEQVWTKNKAPNITQYQTAGEGRKQAIKKIENNIQDMYKFFS